MKNYTLILMAVATLSTVACKNDKQNNEGDMNTTEMDSTSMEDSTMDQDTTAMKDMTVQMESKSESNASGTVTFTTDDNGEVTMKAEMMGLEPGTHAIHLHENADCSADDATSAGGHWNPTNEKHGKWGDPEGYHKGDIGNFEADADGKGSITFTTDEWCVGCEDPNKNIVGKGIIVHLGADDFTTQPSGDAGARVSCGGIVE